MPNDVRPLASYWLEGLREISCYFFPKPDELDDVALRDALNAIGVHIAADQDRFTRVVRGAGESEGFAARIDYNGTDSGDEAAEVVPRLTFEVRDTDLDVSTAVDVAQLPVRLLSTYRANLDEAPVIVFTSFVLPQSEWQPAFTLPMTIPAVADVAGTTPEIHGFEFVYPPGASLSRASVSLEPFVAQELRLRLMFSLRVGAPNTLLERVCETAAGHLPAFANRVTSATKPAPDTRPVPTSAA